MEILAYILLAILILAVVVIGGAALIVWLIFRKAE